MIKAFPLVVLSLWSTGCHTHPFTQTVTHRATLADNNQDYDRSVEKRSDALYQSGAFKNRGDADTKAREEADHRYGERVPDYSTSWTWGGNSRKTLTQDDYDKLAKDAKGR